MFPCNVIQDASPNYNLATTARGMYRERCMAEDRYTNRNIICCQTTCDLCGLVVIGIEPTEFPVEKPDDSALIILGHLDNDVFRSYVPVREDDFARSSKVAKMVDQQRASKFGIREHKAVEVVPTPKGLCAAPEVSSLIFAAFASHTAKGTVPWPR
jgi:hypothetical protein